MGKQITFVLTPGDMEQLFCIIKDVESLFVLHSRAPTAEARVVDSPDVVEGDRYWLYYYLVLKGQLADVVMKKVNGQSYWTIDSLRSPVVELSRSYCSDNSVRVGRLWYETSYYGQDGALVEKPANFKNWAKQLLGLARKGLIKRSTEYFGREADELVRAGKLQVLRP